MEGIFLVDKPTGITSHDVVYAVRTLTRVKRVGHAGTLDPLATGLLIVLVGKGATKLSDTLRGNNKSYIITMEFGRSTDSLDSDGNKTVSLNFSDPKLNNLTLNMFKTAAANFVGTYEQTVPLYSAVKVDGKKLYEVARKDQTPASLPSRNVTISELKVLSFTPGGTKHYPFAQLKTTVSSGTYTRSLVRDIGGKLGIPTVQTALRRTKAGNFSIEDAKTLESLRVNDIIPLARVNELLGYGAIV